MGEPARKLDDDGRGVRPRKERPPGRILPLRRRAAPAAEPRDWVLDRIVLWYRTRRD